MRFKLCKFLQDFDDINSNNNLNPFSDILLLDKFNKSIERVFILINDFIISLNWYILYILSDKSISEIYEQSQCFCNSSNIL